MKYVILLIYILINITFAYKYGIRQQHIQIEYLIPLYFLILFGIPLTVFLTKWKETVYKNLFYVVSILFFIIIIGINLCVDGNELNVDRWSAMEVAIQALLDGEYPYTAIDHTNKHTSNLPSLLILGFPFYLLGSVGFLQNFTFLLFCYIIHISFNSSKAKLISLLLLIGSAFYLWEIYAKSDLMSNFIIILSFIVYISLKKDKNPFLSPVKIGIISSLLFLTRLTSIIPLTLFLFPSFIKIDLKKKILFISIAICTIIILSIATIFNYPDIKTLKNYNPIVLQNAFIPFTTSLLFIIIPVLFSIKPKPLKKCIEYCVIFLSIPVFYYIINSLLDLGFYKSIIGLNVDISYFNFCTPFIIYYMGIILDKKTTLLEN